MRRGKNMTEPSSSRKGTISFCLRREIIPDFFPYLCRKICGNCSTAFKQCGDAPVDEGLFKVGYRPAEAARAFGIGKTTVYAWIGSGRLDARSVGGITIITGASVRKLLEEAPPAAVATQPDAPGRYRKVEQPEAPRKRGRPKKVVPYWPPPPATGGEP
jgi:hypothetical protein